MKQLHELSNAEKREFSGGLSAVARVLGIGERSLRNYQDKGVHDEPIPLKKVRTNVYDITDAEDWLRSRKKGVFKKGIQASPASENEEDLNIGYKIQQQELRRVTADADLKTHRVATEVDSLFNAESLALLHRLFLAYAGSLIRGIPMEVTKTYVGEPWADPVRKDIERVVEGRIEDIYSFLMTVAGTTLTTVDGQPNHKAVKHFDFSKDDRSFKITLQIDGEEPIEITNEEEPHVSTA